MSARALFISPIPTIRPARSRRGRKLRRLHAALPPSVVLVLDQAYAEYLSAEQDDDGLALAEKAANILVTRTFSKIHGLAAERIGWGYSSAAIIDAMHRIRAPFCCTTMGQQAAIAAINDDAFQERSRAHNRIWREWFSNEMAALGNHGLKVVPSAANFVLLIFEGTVSAEFVYRALMDEGYATRWLPGQGLRDGLRVTIGQERDMRAVAATIRNLLAGQG